MRATFEDVTPAKAKKWLEEHNTMNRRIRPKYVAMLAREMSADRWQDHHQAIGFTDDDSIVDGQHRLAAVVESGRTQRFLVVRGVPRGAISVIDAHSHRNTRDALRLVHGLDTTDRAVSAAIYIDTHGARSRLAPAERVATYLRYRRLVERAEKMFNTNKPGICRASVLAVIARSLAKHTAEEVEPFCQLLLTGETHRKRDRAAIKLRDWLMIAHTRKLHAAVFSTSAYRRAEFALDAWLHDKGDVTLREATEELFYLRGERPAVATEADVADAAE